MYSLRIRTKRVGSAHSERSCGDARSGEHSNNRNIVDQRNIGGKKLAIVGEKTEHREGD